VPKAPTWLAAAIVAGCGVEVTRIDGERIELEAAVLVVADDHGRPIRLTEPFGVERGEIGFGALPSVTLEGEERAIVVGFSRSDLSSLWRGLEAVEKSAIRFAIGSRPEKAELELLPSGKIVVAPLPALARAIDVTEGAPLPGPSTVLDGLRLEVALPEDRPAPTLQPFGASARLFADGERLAGFDPQKEIDFRIQRLARVDDAHVLAMTKHLLLFVTRGGEVSREQGDISGPNDYYAVYQLGSSIRSLSAIAVSPEPGPDGRKKVLVVGVGGAGIWELSVDAGGLRLVGSATVSFCPEIGPVEMMEVLIDDRGVELVGAQEGLFFLREPGQRGFRCVDGLRDRHRAALLKRDTKISPISMLRPSADPAHPQLIGTESGAVFTGDAKEDRFDPLVDVDEFSDQGQDVHIHDAIRLRGANGRKETWITGRWGTVLYQIEGHPWSTVLPPMPGELVPCANATTNGLYGDLRSVVAGPEYVYLLLPQCTGLLRLRLSDLSPSAVARSGEPIANSLLDMMAMIASGGRLITGGAGGGLYEMELE
jgi:hypothetical protein